MSVSGSVYGVIELVGTSDTSWERAAVAAVEQAARSLRDLRVAEIAKLDLRLGDGGAIVYRARLKISFRYEDDPLAPSVAVIPARRRTVSGGGQVAQWRPGGRLYGAARVVARSLYGTLWQATVEGSHHIPGRGPAIVAANHLSFFDSIVLAVTLPRGVGFVGKAEYLDSWKTRRLLPALGMIPVDRNRGHQAMGALEAAAKILDAGGLFVIYPEGTRSRDGKLHAGHRGVGHLALATGAPIIPTGIVGTDVVQPPGSRFPRPFRPVAVRFGEPIDPANFEGVKHHRRRRITEEVMRSIQALSGQERARN
jgi:1-acyl-sn-glycerol-3-phosphate acyltransferase